MKKKCSKNPIVQYACLSSRLHQLIYDATMLVSSINDMASDADGW